MPEPEVTSVSSAWFPDTEATIYGNNLGTDEGSVTLVYPDDGTVVVLPVNAWTDTEVTVTLPTELAPQQEVYVNLKGGTADAEYDARSASDVTRTPPTTPAANLQPNDWVVLSPTSTVEATPTASDLLVITGQIVTWDSRLGEYTVRWENATPSPAQVTPSDIYVLGGLTLKRAEEAGIL
jgi:hypothetical protein